MMLGSGEQREWTFIDIISVISFCVGLVNLDYNIGQSDLDNQTQELDRRLKEVVDDIHRHLQQQDAKIDLILERIDYDTDKGISRPDER